MAILCGCEMENEIKTKLTLVYHRNKKKNCKYSTTCYFARVNTTAVVKYL